MRTIALLIYFISFILLLVGTAMIFYHFHRFRVGGGYRALIIVFLVGSVFLFLAGFAAFASVDWEAVDALSIKHLPQYQHYDSIQIR